VATTDALAGDDLEIVIGTTTVTNQDGDLAHMVAPTR